MDFKMSSRAALEIQLFHVLGYLQYTGLTTRM